MTILDRDTTSKKKEENIPNRQSNQEKSNWNQRARQNHTQRARHATSIHRRDQGPSGDFLYYNSAAVQRNTRKEFTHCETNPTHIDVTRDDISRAHLKPKGLSKSSSILSTNEELLNSIGNLNKDEMHSARGTSSTGISATHEVSLPTTSAHLTKTCGRVTKKSDKKVNHKRKYRRTVPYGQSVKSSKHHALNNCQILSSSTSKQLEDTTEKQGKICKFPTATCITETFPNVGEVYTPCHFTNEAPGYMNSVSREDCRSVNGFVNECSESSEATHNSDDEHDHDRLKRLNHGIDFKNLEEEFEKKLKMDRGFVIKPMVEDGACLFRAVADQIYGDQDMHDEVRKNCMNYMTKNADYYSNYITEDFNSYIERKHQPHTFGNNLEMQAMAELYNRPFEVYQYTSDPINTFQTSHVSANPPIRVSYHQNSHYNSVIDPYKATIGVGLGLPSFKPGLVDKGMLSAAKKASEDLWEQQMLNDKVVATDWETTDDAILEQVARESYMEYIEQKSSKIKEVEVKHSDPKRSPPREICSPVEETNPKVFAQKTVVKEFPKKSNRGIQHANSDWVAEDEEWEVLSQVLANSQQEYMDVLKQHAAHSKATCSKYT